MKNAGTIKLTMKTDYRKNQAKLRFKIAGLLVSLAEKIGKTTINVTLERKG